MMRNVTPHVGAMQSGMTCEKRITVSPIASPTLANNRATRWVNWLRAWQEYRPYQRLTATFDIAAKNGKLPFVNFLPRYSS
jgi:hypothetical protein